MWPSVAVFGAWTPCLVDKSASRAQRVLELPGEDQTLGELILAAKPSHDGVDAKGNAWHSRLICLSEGGNHYTGAAPDGRHRE